MGHLIQLLDRHKEMNGKTESGVKEGRKVKDGGDNQRKERKREEFEIITRKGRGERKEGGARKGRQDRRIEKVDDYTAEEKREGEEIKGKERRMRVER